MKPLRYVTISFLVLCSLILTHTTMTNGIQNNDVKQEATDIPTWVVNDHWIFDASIYSDTENGLFDIDSEALTFTIHNITTITHENVLIDVYYVDVSGPISGTFENDTISGDISGDIIGTAIVKQSDLSLIHLNISMVGILEWLIFDFDFNIDSVSTYYPSFEYYDFPVSTGETWNSSAMVHQNTSIYVENLFTNESESIESIQGTISCESIEEITVPAGLFSCYHIISVDEESTIESWYNTTVANMVKFHLFQTNETSTNIVDLNLTSYTLQSQQIHIDAGLFPPIVEIGDSVTAMGHVYSDGSPLENADISICIPYTGEIYSTVTNITGGFSLSFSAPLLLDSTKTSYDIGSDGVLIEASDGENHGYRLKSLTITGIAITSVQATPQIQIESNTVNISAHIFSVEPLQDIRINITGPLGFDSQNISLVHYNESLYYLSQVYTIVGEYNYYIWIINEENESVRSELYSFIIVSGNEIVDINQSLMDRGFPIRHALDGDWAAAQSFIPTLDSISKAEIYMRRFGTPEFNLTVELREDHPEGLLVATLMFAPEEIPTNWGWVSFDFMDIIVSSGIEYFIVCPPAPSGVTTSFGYEWAYAFGNQYDDGSFWFTRDGGSLWRDLPTMYDFTFRTYGMY